MNSMQPKIEKFLPLGIWIIAVILLCDAYYDLWDISHYDWYRVMQADLPDGVVCLRYIGSVSLRVLTIWAVAGVLFRREPYRKMLVVLSCLNVLIAVFQHRYASFVFISSYLQINSEDFLQSINLFGRWYYPGVLARMLNVWAQEILAAAVTIGFFTNPKVRKLFQ